MTRPALSGPGARRAAAALCLAILAVAVQAPRSAGAQALAAPVASAAPPKAGRGWTAIRVAKWALLGVAAGFGTYALTHSDRADRAYGDLRALCSEEPNACEIDGGRYMGARAESLYRGSVREDRRAQVGILGGQLALLGSVALFVVDLRNGRGPENIPFPGAGLRRGVVVGATLRF